MPSSKSISNRLLIINALSGGRSQLMNLAESDDTIVMRRAMDSEDEIKDVGHAGTAMRFLTAYYALGDAAVVLTGSERMKQRPIGELVDALLSLGAQIEYMGAPGYPPLHIRGTRLRGGRLTVNGSISSQFISAILMIAPMIRSGLELELSGSIVSEAYIRMTLELMKMHGVGYTWSGNRIKVPEGKYSRDGFMVESDWSAASYWYAIASLSDGSRIQLPHLFKNSLQGDSVLSNIFKSLQVVTEYQPDGIRISKQSGEDQGRMELDFTSCPDLAQTLAVLLCAKGINFRFTGTQTLRIKETDRISALQRELGKFGFLLRSDEGGNFLEWNGEKQEKDSEPVIETYHDHRMAMAFAPLALKFDYITIKEPMVVTKSYPQFWEDLKKTGFSVKEIQ